MDRAAEDTRLRTEVAWRGDWPWRGINGFRSDLAYFPESEHTVAISNARTSRELLDGADPRTAVVFVYFLTVPGSSRREGDWKATFTMKASADEW